MTNNLWNKTLAPSPADPLAECVYGSRLIGSDPNMVLHGGGNSSVKTPFSDITGSEIDALWVKGSGWDMASIEKGGFTPLPIHRLMQLLDLERLSDTEMMRELSAARLNPAAPQPSVETLLHALIPHQAVFHSHADAIVTLTNLSDGRRRVRQVLGEQVMIVPYVMPGFRPGQNGPGHVAGRGRRFNRDGSDEPWSVHLRRERPSGLSTACGTDRAGQPVAGPARPTSGKEP